MVSFAKERMTRVRISIYSWHYSHALRPEPYSLGLAAADAIAPGRWALWYPVEMSATLIPESGPPMNVTVKLRGGPLTIFFPNADGKSATFKSSLLP